MGAVGFTMPRVSTALEAGAGAALPALMAASVAVISCGAACASVVPLDDCAATGADAGAAASASWCLKCEHPETAKDRIKRPATPRAPST